MDCSFDWQCRLVILILEGADPKTEKKGLERKKTKRIGGGGRGWRGGDCKSGWIQNLRERDFVKRERGGGVGAGAKSQGREAAWIAVLAGSAGR